MISGDKIINYFKYYTYSRDSIFLKKEVDMLCVLVDIIVIMVFTFSVVMDKQGIYLIK